MSPSDSTDIIKYIADCEADMQRISDALRDKLKRCELDLDLCEEVFHELDYLNIAFRFGQIRRYLRIAQGIPLKSQLAPVAQVRDVIGSPIEVGQSASMQIGDKVRPAEIQNAPPSGPAPPPTWKDVWSALFR